MELTQRPVLRPLSVGQILDRAFRLYQGNFLTFLAIVAVVQLPLAVVQVINAAAAQSGSLALAGLVSLLAIVLVLAGVAANQIASAALSRAVADVYLGRTTSFAAAYRGVTPLIGNIFVTLIVTFLVAIGLFIFAIIPCVGWTAGMGMIMFFTGAIVPMVGTVIVLENKAGFDALRRGWDLTRRRFWPVMGYVVLLSLLVFAITVGPSFLLSYLSSFVWSGFDPSVPVSTGNIPQAPLWATILQLLVTTALQTVILPIQLAAASVLYFDLRVRNEGFDLELASSVQIPEGSDLDALIAKAPAAQSGQLVVGDEWTNFFAVGIAFWVIAIVLGVVFGSLITSLLLPSFVP